MATGEMLSNAPVCLRVVGNDRGLGFDVLANLAVQRFGVHSWNWVCLGAAVSLNEHNHGHLFGAASALALTLVSRPAAHIGFIDFDIVF